MVILEKTTLVWCEEYYKMDAVNTTDIDNYQTNIFVQKAVKECFEKAVNKRLMSDRPIGCLLSGGLDSV